MVNSRQPLTALAGEWKTMATKRERRVVMQRGGTRARRASVQGAAVHAAADIVEQRADHDVVEVDTDAVVEELFRDVPGNLGDCDGVLVPVFRLFKAGQQEFECLLVEAAGLSYSLGLFGFFSSSGFVSGFSASGFFASSGFLASSAAFSSFSFCLLHHSSHFLVAVSRSADSAL